MNPAVWRRRFPPAAAGLKAERGAVAAEFALVVGLLVLLTFTLFELAVVLNRQVVLVQAAREGVRRAVVEGGDTREVREVIAAQLRAGGLDPDRVTVSIRPRSAGYGATLYVRLDTELRPVTPMARRLWGNGFHLRAEMQGRNERIRPAP